MCTTNRNEAGAKPRREQRRKKSGSERTVVCVRWLGVQRIQTMRYRFCFRTNTTHTQSDSFPRPFQCGAHNRARGGGGPFKIQEGTSMVIATSNIINQKVRYYITERSPRAIWPQRKRRVSPIVLFVWCICVSVSLSCHHRHRQTQSHFTWASATAGQLYRFHSRRGVLSFIVFTFRRVYYKTVFCRPTAHTHTHPTD